jgi:hypothetical protein
MKLKVREPQRPAPTKSQVSVLVSAARVIEAHVEDGIERERLVAYLRDLAGQLGHELERRSSDISSCA